MSNVTEIDYLEEKGAHILAARVRAYWARRGGPQPVVWVEKVVRGNRSLDYIYCVSSDMRNGRPV